MEDNKKVLLEYKTECEGQEIEIEVLPLIDDEIKEIDQELEELRKQIKNNNEEINKYTSYADLLDISVSAGVGVLSGIIDIFMFNDLSIGNANDIGGEMIEECIMDSAKKVGFKGDSFAGAIKFLEKKYPMASDTAINDFGGGSQHHLRDFGHHFSPVGLMCSVLTQFTKKAYGVDTAGKFIKVPLNAAGEQLIGSNFQEKITYGVINWWGHLLSDMAGSSKTISKHGVGAGIPGPIGGLLKEMSSLSIFNKGDKNEFSIWTTKLFNGTLLAERDASGKIIKENKFDLRSEVGYGKILAKQSLPVIINDCIVRAFYFIRRLYDELKETNVSSFKDLKDLNWKNTLPYKNRTITRMLSVSTGVMSAIDLTTAAVRAYKDSCGNFYAWLGSFALKINYVGIGTTFIDLSKDGIMEVKLHNRVNKKIELYTEYQALLNVKVYYKQADTWKAANDDEKSLNAVIERMYEVNKYFINESDENKKDIKDISDNLNKLSDKNKDLFDDIKDILDWGDINE